jgi:hypothetical protein
VRLLSLLRRLVLDGAYRVDTEPPVFRRIEPRRQEELQALVERVAERIGRALERQGVLSRDADFVPQFQLLPLYPRGLLPR